MKASIALILSAAIVFSPLHGSFASWEDDRFLYNNPNSRFNDIQLNQNNPLALNFRPNFQMPSFEIRTPMAPDLTINTWTMKMPEINVFDIGQSVWTYQRVDNHFNTDLKATDQYSANINFKFGDTVAERRVGMDLGNMKFIEGQYAPESFTRTYKDDMGNSLVRERTNQTGEMNDSYNSFLQTYQRKDQLASANLTLDPSFISAKRPVDPPIELIEGFSEKWTMSIADEGGVRRNSDISLQIDSIKNDTNFHRFVSEYSGTINDGRQSYSFTVTSPHDVNGTIQSLNIEISGKGTPTANISWKPVEGQSSDAAFSLLRENLPVPLFVGPRSNFRLNGVDLVEAPLHVTTKGDLSAKQLGTPQDLANLIGKENLGIEVSFSPPAPLRQGFGGQAPDSPKIGLSLGNSLRNLRYMLSGQWAEVKGLRQQLGTMQNQEPGKFVLAAGFSDPSFMGIDDMKVQLQNARHSRMSQSGIQNFQKKGYDLDSRFRGNDEYRHNPQIQSAGPHTTNILGAPQGIQENPASASRGWSGNTFHMTDADWRAENPEKAMATTPGKMEAFWSATQDKIKMGMDNGLARPFMFGVAAAVSLAKAVTIDLGKTLWGVVKGLFSGGQERWALASAGWKAVKADAGNSVAMVGRILAGVAGWVLSFSPKDSHVRELSEKLDNWSGRGKFITDSELRERFPHNPNAKFAVFPGIDNNGAEIFKGPNGEPQSFSQNQRDQILNFMRDKRPFSSRQEEDSIKGILSQTDFIAVYSGDPVVDVLSMCFEQGGWPVASRKVMEPFLGYQYEGVYFHSAGGAVKLNYGDSIKAGYTAFIGAAGMHDGWYNNIQGDKIQNTFDLVPNLAPDTSGKGIGVRFTLRFGNGGSIINRRASNSPGLFELEQNHSYMDYFVTDQLNREKNPPQEPRGVSIKDPNFDWKIRQMLPEWARERM